jgi:hypothetical protein
VRIAWLDRPVRLLPDFGPTVLGVAKDTPMGTTTFKRWQAMAAERGVGTPQEAADRG